MSEKYQEFNAELLKLNANNLKEIIINNIDTFTGKFNSSNNNKKKYGLINLLVNRNADFTKNIINMIYLININKLKTFNEINNYKLSKQQIIQEYV